MKRRLLLILGLLALLFVLPGLPPVRNALLRWGASFAARAGYTVAYTKSSGNLLYRVGLENLKVKGPGVAVTAKTAKLGYTLPALLTGTLPLRAEVLGVRGTLDLSQVAPQTLATPPATSGTPAAAAPRRTWVKPVLTQANLSDVALEVSGAPFRLPDAKVTRLELQKTSGGFSFRTTLAVQNAGLTANGTVALSPLKLDAAVQRADVALAQSYFDGLKGGVVTGKLQADAQGVTADLELQNGLVELVGLELSRVSGPVRVRNRKLTTDLTGQALGGPLKGTGTVDLAAQRWQADVTGNAALSNALVWVSQGRLSKPIVKNGLGASGNAAVNLSVGGWQTFALSGRASGQGTLLGEPLRKLNVNFGFKSAVGTRVKATASLGGEPFRFALTPQGQGFTLTAGGTKLPLQRFGQTATADLNVALSSQQGALTGTTDLTLNTQLLGRSATLRANAAAKGQGTNGQRWHVGLSGTDALGAKLTGGLELNGNLLNGTVRAAQLTLPALADPVTVTARANGPLSKLPLTLRLTGPAGAPGVHPTLGGVRAEADFSGRATAILKNGALTHIRGDFGPLELAGTLSDLRYTLAPTALSGRAAGSVTLQNGQVSRQGGLSATAQLETQNLRGAGISLPDLNAKLELSRTASPQGDKLSASLTDKAAGVAVNLQNGELKGTLNGTRIGALGKTFMANGTVSGKTAQLAQRLQLDLRAKTTGKSPATTLKAAGTAQNAKLSLKSEPGATLAGRTLPGGLDLSGDASLKNQRAALSGKLGGVGVSVAATPDASGKVQTQAKLTGGGQSFSARFGSLKSWSTNGTLPLGELGRALGLPLRGTLQTTLARQGSTFSGQAAVNGTAFGLPLEARATSQNDKLSLNASANTFGQPLTLSGTALPETDATLTLGEYGAARLTGRYPALTLTGSGHVPGVSQVGLELAAQPWQLSGKLAQGQAELRVGKSRLTAQQGKNGWTLGAQLEQQARFRGTPLELAADLARSPQSPDGRVRGSLSWGGAPLKLSGTLRKLELSGSVPAETVQPGLLGTLGLTAQVDALTQAYTVRSSWQYNGSEVLAIKANGKRADVTATVQGQGLNARLGTKSGKFRWTVRADQVALKQLPVTALQPLDAQLNGTLSRDAAGYRGRLALTAGDVTAQLQGQNRRLEVKGDFQRGTLSASANGILLPKLNVSLKAKAGSAATFQGRLQGSLSRPQLSGRIETAAQSFGGGQVTLPARQFEVGASVQNGLNVSLTGDQTRVQFQNGTWDGSVTLPFNLRGQPHRLSAAVQGALAQPTLNAKLTGPTVQGPLTLSRSGLTGDLSVTPKLSAVSEANLQVTLAASPDLSWKVALKGRATLPYRSLPASLTGQFSGRGTRYRGSARLEVAGQQVPLRVSGEAGRAQARATFEGLELSAFAPLTGTLSGNVRLGTTGGGLRYFADLSAQGQAAGKAFELTFSADHATGLALRGTVAGASITVKGALPLKTLNVRVADSETPLELKATLGFGETLTLNGEGRWRGRALTLRGAYALTPGDGNLSASLGDAVLSAELTQTQAGRTLSADLTAPTGLLTLKTPLSASLELVQNGQTLEVSAFDARFGANTLSLSGTVPSLSSTGQPQGALDGTLLVPVAGEPVALRLTALRRGYLASLTQGELILRGVLSPGFRPERVRLIGSLARPEGTLQSDLVWQLGAGFSGRADATVAAREASVALTLRGGQGQTQGQLGLESSASYRGVRVATLAAELSAAPWRDQSVNGTLEVSAPLAQLSPVWPGEPLQLAGSLALSGTVTTPELQGPLELRGALAADGTLQASRQGAQLSFTGDGLRGVAAVDAEGYRTTVTLTRLGLSGLLPRFARFPTSLSGVLRATQRWGSAPEIQSDLQLASGSSSVSSRVRFNGGLSGSLKLDVRLGDLLAGWQGRVQGPVFLSPGAPLAGTLELSGLGPKAAAWRLGGQLGVAGNVTSPVVTLALRGQGSASGTLQATAAPRQGRLELSSTLALLGATTDLTLTRTNAGVSGAGTLGYRNFRAALKTQGEQGRLQLQGQDKLAGWRGVVGPTRFSLTGPLASFNSQLAGTLALEGGTALRQLSGTLGGVTFGPVTLSDVAFRRSGGKLELRGDALSAQLGLSGALPWTLGKLKLSGPGSSTLEVSGQGTRTQGRLTGQLATPAFSLPLSARYAPEGLALTARGALPLGELELRARYQDRWRGQLSVTETDGGKQLLSGNLAGQLTAPTLAGTLELSRNVGSVKGSFSVGREALKLDAQVTSPQAAPLNVTGSGWPLQVQLSSPQAARADAAQNTLGLALKRGRLEPSGALALAVGPARLELRAGGDAGHTLVLQLGVPVAAGLLLRTSLPAAPGDYAALLNGVTFRGAGKTSGTLTLAAQPVPQLSAKALQWQTPAGTLTLSGQGTLADVAADLSGRWTGTPAAPVPWLRGSVPFRVQATNKKLDVSSSKLGQLHVQYGAPGTPTGAAGLALQSRLTLGQGQLFANVSYTRTGGPSGTLTARKLPVFSVGKSVATLTSQLALSESGVSGDGALALAGGQLSVSGAAGWARLLPKTLTRFVPAQTEALAAQLRLSRFDVGGLPQVAARLPHLSAPVSGVATVSATQIVGQLIAPKLKVLSNVLPTQVDFNGTLAALEARATIGDSRLNLRYSRTPSGPNLAGLVTLESFPLQALPEAVVGASQVEANVTGAARFDLPLRHPATGYVRLATERLSLQSTDPESTGKVTQGEVALRFENGSLYVERAEFRGDGFWRAAGVLTPDNLDFTLEAQNADFTPLLRLVPPLAALNVGAQGSLSAQASGSASAPDITLRSPRLALSVAGTRYRAVDTQATLSGGAFGLKGALLGVSPVTGRLELSGSGQINLAPFATSGLALRFSGGATVPTLGKVSAIQGRIYPSDTGWQLDSRAVLGRPLRVSGSLAPLALSIKGQALNVQARRLYVASSSTDVDLKLRARNGIFTLSGGAFVNQAELSLNRSDVAPTPAAPPGSGTPASPKPAPAPETSTNSASAGTAAGTAPGAPTPTDAASSAPHRVTNPVLARIRFDNVSLQAPREVLFNEAFGSAELSLELTLTGTAAQPLLDGQAQTLSGSIRFSGQDFSLVKAVATFNPARGVYPTLALEATASFDTSRALGGAQSAISVVEPTTPTFEVQLQITGSFEENSSGRRVLKLSPKLSSNAMIQERGSSTPRPLTEAELVSLLTLGRVQLDAAVGSANSLAGTVAESALNTAVDLLVVSELQNALNNVLGADLLEIRTSAFSSILGAEGAQQNFGVSVKLGGYLSDNLFASVQVGRYNDPERAYALSNEFLLRYTAAPLELNFSGGVNFSVAPSVLSSVTNFSLGLSYAITPLISLDASLDTSAGGTPLDTSARGRNTSIGFGVSFTW